MSQASNSKAISNHLKMKWTGEVDHGPDQTKTVNASLSKSFARTSARRTSQHTVGSS